LASGARFSPAAAAPALVWSPEGGREELAPENLTHIPFECPAETRDFPDEPVPFVRKTDDSHFRKNSQIGLNGPKRAVTGKRAEFVSFGNLDKVPYEKPERVTVHHTIEVYER
jgi:hypothetical protein